MHLHYLTFDVADDESGACSYDAMASVLPDRLPALLTEVATVLNWAFREFGSPSITGADGGWDFHLHATGEPDTSLEIGYDPHRQRAVVSAGSCERVTVTLTVSGHRGFGEAFREAFIESD